jgi:hypothetical protein
MLQQSQWQRLHALACLVRGVGVAAPLPQTSLQTTQYQQSMVAGVTWQRGRQHLRGGRQSSTGGKHNWQQAWQHLGVLSRCVVASLSCACAPFADLPCPTPLAWLYHEVLFLQQTSLRPFVAKPCAWADPSTLSSCLMPAPRTSPSTEATPYD